MPINLLPANNQIWASQGKVETIAPEKYLIGWTGAVSDYAFASWVNSLFNQADLRYNTMIETINAMMQHGILVWNALYQYPKDATVTFMGRIYRARKSNAGKNPPSGYNSDDNWELIISQDYFTEQINLKSNIESPAFTGVPTTPTPLNKNTQTQIVNIAYVESELNKRITGESVIDLSTLDNNKAYPILLAKNNKATNSYIYRDAGNGSGNMRLLIEGVGSGLNGTLITSYLNVVNMIDTNASVSTRQFVKKIEAKIGNSVIAVWLRGGVKYNINQRFNEEPFELVTTNKTLENNWIVSMEEWTDGIYLNDGAWEATHILDYTLNYQSTSDTGSVETCGMLFYSATKTPPLGALIANGSAVNRNTYSKLFNKIGVLYGNGDGINTFNLPDLRGVFIRGLDLGRGLDCKEHVSAQGTTTANRANVDGIGSYQLDAIRNMTGSASADRLCMQRNYYAEGVLGTKALNSREAPWYDLDNKGVAITFDASKQVRTTNTSTGEVLVKNLAFLPCIYYL